MRCWVIVVTVVMAAGTGVVRALDATGATPLQSSKPGEIVLPVRLNDQGPFAFILDTGSSHSFIAETLAQKLGAPAVAKSLVQLVDWGGDARDRPARSRDAGTDIRLWSAGVSRPGSNHRSHRSYRRRHRAGRARVSPLYHRLCQSARHLALTRRGTSSWPGQLSPATRRRPVCHRTAPTRFFKPSSNPRQRGGGTRALPA